MGFDEHAQLGTTGHGTRHLGWEFVVDHERFRELWRGMWERLGVVAPDVEGLLGRYGEGHRGYHGVGHVVDCLGELAGYEGEAGRVGEAVWLAVFYHDAVYEPRDSDNEERSAGVARGELGGVLPEGMVEAVVRLVMVTDHKRLPGTVEEKVVVDVDLSILGRGWEEFCAYERGVRKEYAFVEEGAFRAGRARVLRGFLGRGRIYATGYFFERYEGRARENLRRSIAQLGG